MENLLKVLRHMHFMARLRAMNVAFPRLLAPRCGKGFYKSLFLVPASRRRGKF
jgi:hypothetical protein